MLSSHAAIATKALLLGLLLICIDCDSRTDEAGEANRAIVAAAQSVPTAQPMTPTPPRALGVGDACTGSDGWQRASSLPNGASAPLKPTAIPIPSQELDFHQLPPRIGYCIQPGGIYPHGYFTMSCEAKEDCPPGSWCDGGQCRHQCSRDSECRPPTRCQGESLKYCYDDPPRQERRKARAKAKAEEISRKPGIASSTKE